MLLFYYYLYLYIIYISIMKFKFVYLNFFIHFIIIFKNITFISLSLDSGQHSTHRC